MAGLDRSALLGSMMVHQSSSFKAPGSVKSNKSVTINAPVKTMLMQPPDEKEMRNILEPLDKQPPAGEEGGDGSVGKTDEAAEPPQGASGKALSAQIKSLSASTESLTMPAWLETAGDRAARLEKKRLTEERMAEARREKRAAMEGMVRGLVVELFVEGVIHKAYLRDMGRRSKAEAERLAEEAVCFRMCGGLTESDSQDIKGGLMLQEWHRHEVPGTDQLHGLLVKKHESGTWVDRARKNVRVKFMHGQKEVIKNPRVSEESRSYVGVAYRGGPRVVKEPGPSWKELYVGQLVMLTPDAVRRRELYDLEDGSGTRYRRNRGYTLDKSLEMSIGVIVNALGDIEMLTHVTYHPGKKITNYTCYPGGQCWVRWDYSKEVSMVWHERLQANPKANSMEEIEERTDMIERKDWEALDENVLALNARVSHLSQDVVCRLRIKAVTARMEAHHKVKGFLPKLGRFGSSENS
mmetsp:Transcript_4748/g.12008  ORF Transcript_4748/g.12008 Transcript_4748/m.12008 type:complete len:466 (+) Transcript_4748:68-1465(+)